MGMRFVYYFKKFDKIWEESFAVSRGGLACGLSWCGAYALFIAQRKGKSTIFKANSCKRIAPAQFRTLDFAEREG
jgi:hypothetical protein